MTNKLWYSETGGSNLTLEFSKGFDCLLCWGCSCVIHCI